MPPKKIYKNKSQTNDVMDLNTTATYLIIVESPSKCKKIESYLGEEYCCIASKGHIRSIEGLKSINTKGDFNAKFSNIEEKQPHINTMMKIISRFSKSNIILATDDDREGEAIAWHICQVFDLPVETTQRILFHEVTKNALLTTVKNPTKINMDLVYAQHARQILDIIVGYKVSPFLWKYLYHNKSNSLSAGRCQTPALRLVYDNELEIKNNKQIEYKHKIQAKFFEKGIPYVLNHEFDDSDKVLEFMEKSKDFHHVLTTCSPKESKRAPPKPFNTSRLLQTASNVLNMSPKDTMSLCQILYQNGYITYMRTDSMKYSTVYLEQVKKHIIDAWKKEEYLGDIDVLENKDENNPHEAIRVTQLDINKVPSSDNTRLVSLYKLIWKNSVESCMSEAVYSCVDTKITAPLGYAYSHTIEIPKFMGWKKVGEKEITDTQNDASALLMYIKSLENITKPLLFQNIESNVVIHNKHTHYTEASLINKLEDLGIGRPSTFATIIETIQTREYIKRKDVDGNVIKCIEYRLNSNKVLNKEEKERVFGNEKNKLVLQPIGLLTIEFLIKHFHDLFSYDYTKTMETLLDKVSSGENPEWNSICKQCYNEIKELSKPVAKVERQIYPIDEEHDFIFQQHGPVIRKVNSDGTIEYTPVKKDIKIDLEKLQRNEYTLDELYEIKNSYLGKYKDEDLLLKSGKFGPYVEWGGNKESVKNIGKPLNDLVLEDVVEFLETSKSASNSKTILRELTPEMSIRKGKFGAYVYYKTHHMQKPEFFNIRKFTQGYSICEPEILIQWIKDTYNL